MGIFYTDNRIFKKIDPMTRESNQTELLIRSVALKLFEEHGYKRTTLRDVAEHAGTNVALVNYYFRSKKNLFLLLYNEKIQRINSLSDILYDENEIFQNRVTYYMNEMYEQFKADPKLPIFLLSEANYNKELQEELGHDFANLHKSTMDKIQLVLDKEIQAKRVYPITADFFRGTVLALIGRPFIEYPLLVKSGELSMNSLDDFLKRWYKHSLSIIEKMLFV